MCQPYPLSICCSGTSLCQKAVFWHFPYQLGMTVVDLVKVIKAEQKSSGESLLALHCSFLQTAGVITL